MVDAEVVGEQRRDVALEAVELRPRVLADREQHVHVERRVVHDLARARPRSRSARPSPPSSGWYWKYSSNWSRTTSSVPACSVHAPQRLGERRRRAGRAARRPRAPAARRAPPPRAPRTGSSSHERKHADRERRARRRARSASLAQAVDDAGLQQRALADAARPVQERQPRRAQVGAHDRDLLRAPEEEARVVLAERDEPDVRARRARERRVRDRGARRERHRAGASPAARTAAAPRARARTRSARRRRARRCRRVSQSVCSILLTFGSTGSRWIAHDLTTSFCVPQIRFRITRRFQSRSA